jgi:flagellar hook-basal body complex protein FliE
MDYAGAIGSVVPGTFVPDLGKSDETPNVGPIPGGGVAASGETSFKDTVMGMLNDVNSKIQTSDANTRDLATGATNDLSKVVTSVEEANLSLQYTLAIRSKLLAAYTQISNMQI